MVHYDAFSTMHQANRDESFVCLPVKRAGQLSKRDDVRSPKADQIVFIEQVKTSRRPLIATRGMHIPDV